MRTTLPILLLLAIRIPVQIQAQSPIGAAVPSRYIVTYRNGILPADAAARAASTGAKLLQRHELFGIAIMQSSSAAALAADPAVQSIVQDRIVLAHSLSTAAAPTAATNADTLYYSPQGWAVQAVGGFGDNPATRTLGPWNLTKGAGVRIAILDSGVDASHPDIAPNLALNLSEIDQSPNGLPSACDDGTPQDQQGHGTWTASLAAGALGPNTGLIAGVAPQATILNIKVLERLPAAPTQADPTGCIAGEASGLLSWVIQGIEDAVRNHADIISLSLGTLVDITTGDGAGLQATFDSVTHAAFSAGTILIASAGNDGFSLANQRYVELPAQSRDVVAIVASTNPACAENLAAGAICASGPITLPYYSNSGAPLNALAAPGGDYPEGPASNPALSSGWIYGACSSGKPGTLDGPPSDPQHSLGCFNLGHTAYVQAMGTSASAPLAAGAAALILAANPSWNPAAVMAALRNSAITVPTLPNPLVSVTAFLTPASATFTHIATPAQR
jgi:lantibiotic leader peptide-processing serine protease